MHKLMLFIKEVQSEGTVNAGLISATTQYINESFKGDLPRVCLRQFIDTYCGCYGDNSFVECGQSLCLGKVFGLISFPQQTQTNLTLTSASSTNQEGWTPIYSVFAALLSTTCGINEVGLSSLTTSLCALWTFLPLTTSPVMAKPMVSPGSDFLGEEADLMSLFSSSSSSSLSTFSSSTSSGSGSTFLFAFTITFKCLVCLTGMAEMGVSLEGGD